MPPHSDRVTSGRSLGESDKLSVPLSTAALPTDWGEWDTERLPISTQCLGSCSGSLQTDKLHDVTQSLRCVESCSYFTFKFTVSVVLLNWVNTKIKIPINVNFCFFTPHSHVCMHDLIILSEA